MLKLAILKLDSVHMTNAADAHMFQSGILKK